MEVAGRRIRGYFAARGGTLGPDHSRYGAIILGAMRSEALSRGVIHTATPRRKRPVIVGVEDTTASAVAVSWAADEARSRGVPLHIVRGYTWATATPYLVADDRYVMAELRKDSASIAHEAARQAHAQDSELVVQCEVSGTCAPDLLIARSVEASLVVLGSRGRGAVARSLLGSVSSEVAARAAAPVVVVCGAPPLAGEGSRVVVGVKADETARPTLAFAFEHAQRHGLEVHAVLCWRPSGIADVRPMPERAERWLAEALCGWREEYPDVPLTSEVVRDDPARALVAAAGASKLLVVGRHGRTPRMGALLGSVSQAAIHHATRPVAVVPVVRDD